MECQAGPSPLLADEKQRLSAEYVTLSIHASKLMTEFVKVKDTSQKQNDVWYALLTQKEYYMNCKKLMSSL